MSRYFLRSATILTILGLSAVGCATRLDSGRPICAGCYSETIRVACVGDSITYGSGIKFRSRDSYPAQLGRMLGEKCGSPQFWRRRRHHAQEGRQTLLGAAGV